MHGKEQVFSTSEVQEFSSLFKGFVMSFDFRLRPLDPAILAKMQMCLIDVGSGSDTRLMVRQVLDWSQ